MKTSESIAAIAAALGKAQSAMGNAAKDARNPHFRNEYATLASVRSAVLPALTAHGIAVVQAPGSDGESVELTTRLIHSSGEWLESTASVRPAKSDPQSYGSALSYLRRYSLAAMAGVAQSDDDAEATDDADLIGDLIAALEEARTPERVEEIRTQATRYSRQIRGEDRTRVARALATATERTKQ